MATKSKLIKDVYYNMNKSKCESAEFIQAVRSNPALYDPDNDGYKMATVKEAIWKELSNQFGVTCDVAKKRWKSLRDTYTKKFRISEEHASNFKYGKELQFLKPYMKAERSHSNITILKTALSLKPNEEFEIRNDNQIQEYQFEEIMEDLTEKDLLQQLDITIFISQIKDHVCIWNKNLSSYNVLEERNRAWMDIGKNLIEDFQLFDQENQLKIVKILRRKWRRLREKYLITKKTLETRPGSNPDKMFSCYSNLNFIEYGIKLKKEFPDEEYKETDSNFALNMKAEYLSDSHMNENFDDENTFELIQDNPNEIEKLVPDTNFLEEEDEDRLFLLSLVKEMKKIPKDHKLDARLNILVVLRNWQKMHYVTDTNQEDFKDIVN